MTQFVQLKAVGIDLSAHRNVANLVDFLLQILWKLGVFRYRAFPYVLH